MRSVVAVIMGLISGLLIYFIAAMVLGTAIPGLVPITFLGGWVFSSWLMIRKTLSASRVATRGFLIGALEWLLVVPAGFIASGRAVGSTITHPTGRYADAQSAGAVIGGGLSFFLITIIALVFATACIIGYFVSKSMKSEMGAELDATMRPCPQCAEPIRLNALKCRYCGAGPTPPIGAMPT